MITLAALLLANAHGFQMPMASVRARAIQAPRHNAMMMADGGEADSGDNVSEETPKITSAELEQMEKYMKPKEPFLGVFDTATPAGAAGGTAVVTIVFGIFIEGCKAIVGDDSIFDLLLY